MKTNSNNESWFEQFLKIEADCSAVDFNAVEKDLLLRIVQTEEEYGSISLLKSEVMVSDEQFDSLESSLFSKIIQYKEYEEPVNECINANQDLTSSQWERLEAKLFSRIEETSELPQWEQILMTPEIKPIDTNWENIENSIFEKVAQFEKQESWVQCTRKESVSIPAVIEQEEQKVCQIINENYKTDLWENEIKKDVIISLNQIERMEEAVFNRIEKHSSALELSKQPFWSFISHYINFYRMAGALSALILITAGAITGWNYYKQSVTAVPTVAYYIDGSIAVSNKITDKISKSCSSVNGSTIKLVNKHGTVQLSNNSGLQFQKLTEKTARYRIDQASFKERADGQITFFVNKRKNDEIFSVITNDYNISVKGTYFVIEPGLNGTVTTKVLEGVIKIAGKDLIEKELKAGQIYTYDTKQNSYIVKNGGQIINREQIDQGPDINSLNSSRLLRVDCSVPGAKVQINGKTCQSLPLTVRQQTGKYTLSISAEGYNSLDTVISITEDLREVDINVSLQKFVAVKKDVAKKVISKPAKPVLLESKPIAEPVISPEQILSILEIDDSLDQHENEVLYQNAQLAEMKGNWENAVELYQKLFDNQNASKLIREDALFSIGRITAENIHNPVKASQVFLTYLALFPNGSFAGESWLRLAELEFSNKPENSIQYYEMFFKMYPQHPRISELRNRVGVIYLQQKRYNEAIHMFKQALNSPVQIKDVDRKIITSNLDRALHESPSANSEENVSSGSVADQ